MTIRDYLVGLGDSPEAVAASLVAQGVRGERGSANTCPVIVGVHRHCRPWPGLIALRPGVLSYRDAQMVDPSCPPAVGECMRRFDAGEFEELVAPR